MKTPRTDAELIHFPNEIPLGWVPADFARKLELELAEALKWKEEDPRMLREQIRVADVAYNHLNDEIKKIRIESSLPDSATLSDVADHFKWLYGQLNELRALPPATAQAMVYMGLLRKYNILKEAIAYGRFFDEGYQTGFGPTVSTCSCCDSYSNNDHKPDCVVKKAKDLLTES